MFNIQEDYILTNIIYFTLIALNLIYFMILRHFKIFNENGNKWNDCFPMVSLITIAVVIRLLFCVTVDIVFAEGDSQYYIEVAEKIKNNENFVTRYETIFPYVIPALYIIGSFLKISFLGTYDTILAINILCCALSVCLIYVIAQRWVNKSLAYIAAMMYVLLPSDIYAVKLFTTEQIYSAISLISIWLFIRATEEKEQYKSKYIFAFIFGVITAFSNVFRPVGIILIVAVVLYIIAFHNDKWKSKSAFILVVCVGYFIVLTLTSNTLSSLLRLNDTKLTYPLPYTLYVGANVESMGAYNQDDVGHFFAKLDDNLKIPDSEKVSLFLNEYKKRVADIGLYDYIKLMITKAYYFIKDDNYSVLTLSKMQVSGFFDYKNIYEFFSTVCNWVHRILVFLTAMGCSWVLFKGRNKLPLFLLIYIAGIIGLHSIIEFSLRYRMVITPLFPLLSILGVDMITKIVYWVHNYLRNLHKRNVN